MANPQVESGHVDIANDLAEAFARIRISGEETQILWVILRKTYGWHKKSDAISLSQFVDITGMNKPNVIRAIHGLLSKKIIIVINIDNARAKVYGINKDFDQWEPLSKKITLSKKIINVINNDNTITKEKKEKRYCANFEIFWKSYPKKKSKGQAEKAFFKIRPNEQLLAIMIARIEQAKTSEDWIEEQGKYIPHPATWLNARGWEDEIEPIKPVSAW